MHRWNEAGLEISESHLFSLHSFALEGMELELDLDSMCMRDYHLLKAEPAPAAISSLSKNPFLCTEQYLGSRV